jgi:hypothetical protein
MKEVYMTKTQKGSPNGIAVVEYKEGEEYNLPDALAYTFVEELECAEYIVDDDETDGIETPESKVKIETPESK